jgi:hypothetical protein
MTIRAFEVAGVDIGGRVLSFPNFLDARQSPKWVRRPPPWERPVMALLSRSAYGSSMGFSARSRIMGKDSNGSMAVDRGRLK